MPWQVLDHTADVGLIATGESLEEALSDLLAGLGHLLCPDGTVEPVEVHRFQVEATSLVDGVIDLLDEVNYLHQMEGFVPVSAEVTLTDDELTALVHGEPYDADKHGYLMEIKATTYHELEVSREPARVQVIFDI